MHKFDAVIGIYLFKLRLVCGTQSEKWKYILQNGGRYGQKKVDFSSQWEKSGTSINIFFQVHNKEQNPANICELKKVDKFTVVLS